GQVNTLDTSDHWKHGQHATIVFVDDEWWVISMEAEAKNNNGAYGFHASKLTFNGNNIMFGVEEHTVYASDAGGVYGADGASNIEALHKSGQLVVTLGGQYADLGEGFNYRTKVKQCHTGLSSPKGAFKVTQRETNRFLDAYTSSTNDFGAVTRTAQQNSSQLWDFTKVSGNIYTIQHQPNDYYLDAWEGSNDSEAVTRFQQGNTTQQWQLVYEYSTNSYQLIQVSSGRYLDAYEDNNDGHDYRAVTRESQNNNSQKWHLSPAPQ
ncbi:MAG: RICIN domain-containing protein, partial [Psychrosphaera sp.]|nr:RICIN domain-containing protein [Psychrosphaera sp.]